MERSRNTFEQQFGTLEKSPTMPVRMPARKKTSLMFRVTNAFARPDETLSDLLTRLHIEEGKYPTEIGATLSISRSTAVKWIHQFVPEAKQAYLTPGAKNSGETTRKLWQDPRHRAKRIARMKDAWSGPEKKAERLARLHNPETKALRAKKTKEYYEQYPQARQKIGEIVKATFKEKRKAAIEVILNGKAQKTLEHMATVQGLPAKEIAQRLNLGIKLVKRLIKDFNITPNPRRLKPKLEVMQERKKSIKKAIENQSFKRLSKRERQILTALYLLDDRFPRQTEIAKDLKCTKGYISIVEKDALAKLSRLDK